MKIILVLLIILISGCGRVYVDEWKEAEKLCGDHKGLNYVWLSGDKTGANCNNGHQYTFSRLTLKGG